MPRKYRESQKDWFGKRGISWHVSVVLRRSTCTPGSFQDESELEALTFVHIVHQAAQDSQTVVAIMRHVIEESRKIMPELKRGFLDKITQDVITVRKQYVQ